MSLPQKSDQVNLKTFPGAQWITEFHFAEFVVNNIAALWILFKKIPNPCLFLSKMKPPFSGNPTEIILIFNYVLYFIPNIYS